MINIACYLQIPGLHAISIMTDPAVERLQSSEPCQLICSHLSSLANPQHDSSSDLVLLCSDGPLMAHQLVLACISPMLYSEFVRSRYDDTVTISLPDLTRADLTQYLEALYQCQDLSAFPHINNMLGFRFVKDCPLNTDTDKEKNFKAESDEDTSTMRRKRRPVFEPWDYCEVDLKADTEDCEDVSPRQQRRRRKEVTPKIDPDVPGTRKKRSQVWQHYVIDPDNGSLVICQICREGVSYLNGGTSAMISHLRVDHKICIQPIVKKGVKRSQDDKAKVKKEPALDPETGMIKKNVGKSRKKRRKDIWQHYNHFPEDNLKAECRICQQVVELKDKCSVSQTLVKHLNTHDIKLELETCSVCGKLFDEKNKRRKHENNHQVKCSCSYCGKLFSDNTARIVHERTHTGEKPYQVSINDNNFAQHRAF